MRLEDYDFELPEDRIAQSPPTSRDASKLLVVDRTKSEGVVHSNFRQLPHWLSPGDLLVVNATRVEPARLRGRRQSGGAVQALLLAPIASETDTRFRALVKLSGRLRTGIRMSFGPEAEQAAGPETKPLAAEIVEVLDAGEVVLAFERGVDPYAVGEPPLPPYIRREREAPRDRERYQTIYARVPGAVAAPTAGLHFSQTLFCDLEARGIERAEVVLHVGPGTFRPLDPSALATGRLHSERFELPAVTARAIEQTRDRGGRVVAVGTTSARVLEARARDDATVEAGTGETDLFLRPGSKRRVVDALVTNFHLPRSSLLLLVAAFAGRERILSAYREAIAHDYRFYSYGDAMLIL
ncbi:MAG: tRNA preQ1(34) S-adenosylmethionine ribosyltransferase-isomerase QueA [bacterium]|nr:tRNA preQ1(34) S-adenosylmethionine ribosyltransferase-isomerase QueA [bacterium]